MSDLGGALQQLMGGPANVNTNSFSITTFASAGATWAEQASAMDINVDIVSGADGGALGIGTGGIGNGVADYEAWVSSMQR